MSQYLKPDTELGYIEDQAEIESLKINNLRHTILGCMLGDFDETGAYIVAPEVVKELIEMPKYVVDTLDNIEVCKSCLKLDKQVTFMVTFEGNKATLTLVEKLSYEANFAINSGTYSNINEYVLDVVETSGEINRNAIYTRWNIGEFGGNTVDIFNCDEEVLEKYFGIVNRFKYLLNANKVLIEKEEAIEEVEASYTNEIFEILKHYPKLQTAVMQQVKTTLTEKKDAISVNKPNFAKTLNEVLENAIQSNLNVVDEKQKQDFETEKRNAVVNLNIKRAEVIETEKVDIDENAEADLNPKVITLKTDNVYQSKSITELAEEFVSANKQISTKQPNDKQPEKNKVYSVLAGVGLTHAIGLNPPPSKIDTQPKPEVSSNSEPTPGTNPTKPVVKGGGNSNRVGKGPTKTGGGSQVKQVKKGEIVKPASTNGRTNTTNDGTTTGGNGTQQRRLFPVMAAGVSSNQEVKGETVDGGLMLLMQRAKSTISTTEKVKAGGGAVVSTGQVVRNSAQGLNTQRAQQTKGEVVEAEVTPE